MADTAATWFLKSESGQPLGQVYRTAADALPAVGSRVEGVGEVVRFKELGSTCAMRRFEVVVRAAA